MTVCLVLQVAIVKVVVSVMYQENVMLDSTVY